MDLSIVAAVGSFLVSERILGPKTFIVIGLSALLSYDLMTKTHDPASLRVYRGPGLIAATIMLAAYSLRTWRRNGVACDELIFLPGTKHGLKHGAISTLEHFQKRLFSEADNSDQEETDGNQIKDSEMVPMVSSNENNENNENESSKPLEFDEGEEANAESPDKLRRKLSCPSLSKSTQEENKEENSNQIIHQQSCPSLSNVTSEESDIENNISKIRNSSSSSLMKEESEAIEEESIDSDKASLNPESWEIEGDGHYAYAPSATSVFGGGLDLMTPVLLNFHLFTMAITQQKHEEDELSPKILPLIFLTVLFFRSVIPFSRRRRFWGTLKYAFIAPFHHVSFRDDFVADVVTSCVKPLQDSVFAIFYYITVIRGLITDAFKLEDLDQLLENNWRLHNIVLPACTVLPLWFKFMQCIRSAYDTKQRWPHLGNAFKYLSAALIIFHAMAYPRDQRGFWWITFFVLATIYQIWWDTMMDWELLVFIPDTSSETSLLLNSEASLSSSDSLLQAWYEYLRNRIKEKWFLIRQKIIFLYKSIHLRSTRTFKEDKFYWRLFWINVSLRSFWMLNFIPTHHLSSNGELVYTFSSDVHNYVAVIMSVAEVTRRCLWGIVRVEIESIKITNPTYESRNRSVERKLRANKKMSISDEEDSSLYFDLFSPWLARKVLLLELFIWGGSFVLLGLIVVR